MNKLNSLYIQNESHRLDNGINNIAFNIGGLEISWYGIIMFIGFIIAIAVCVCKIKFWYKIPLEPFFYFCFLGIPVAILGARLWSFIIGDSSFEPGSNFADGFIAFFNFKKGGMAIQGGILFTLIAGLIFFPLILRLPKYQIRTIKNGVECVKPISSYVYADAIIPCILVGQIIGRWGNFVNGELYGAKVVPQSDLDWLKAVMPIVWEGMHIKVNGAEALYQPLFLYESFANFWGFLIIFVGLEFIKQHKTGDIAASYFIWYGVVRLAMEPLRDKQFMFVMTYVTSSLMVVFGIGFILVNHLYLCKHRDHKTLYHIWTIFQYKCKLLWAHMNKKYKIFLDNIDPDRENYGYRTKPVFIRKDTEVFYYKGH